MNIENRKKIQHTLITSVTTHASTRRTPNANLPLKFSEFFPENHLLIRNDVWYVSSRVYLVCRLISTTPQTMAGRLIGREWSASKQTTPSVDNKRTVRWLKRWQMSLLDGSQPQIINGGNESEEKNGKSGQDRFSAREGGLMRKTADPSTQLSFNCFQVVACVVLVSSIFCVKNWDKNNVQRSNQLNAFI